MRIHAYIEAVKQSKTDLEREMARRPEKDETYCELRERGFLLQDAINTLGMVQNTIFFINNVTDNKENE